MKCEKCSLVTGVWFEQWGMKLCPACHEDMKKELKGNNAVNVRRAWRSVIQACDVPFNRELGKAQRTGDGLPHKEPRTPFESGQCWDSESRKGEDQWNALNATLQCFLRLTKVNTFAPFAKWGNLKLNTSPKPTIGRGSSKMSSRRIGLLGLSLNQSLPK